MTEKARVFVYYFNSFQIIFYEFSKPKDLFKVRNGRGLWEGQHYKQHEIPIDLSCAELRCSHTEQNGVCGCAHTLSLVYLN